MSVKGEMGADAGLGVVNGNRSWRIIDEHTVIADEEVKAGRCDCDRALRTRPRAVGRFVDRDVGVSLQNLNKW